MDNITKEQEKIDEGNNNKITRLNKFKEMAVKVHNNEISKNILKGVKEENERRQQMKTLQKNNAAKKSPKQLKVVLRKLKQINHCPKAL